MGLMKTLCQSSKELNDILDRLNALERGEKFVTKETFNSLNQTVNSINSNVSNLSTDVTNIKNGNNIENIMLANYPVGSIYFSIDSVNPSTKFGGTWVSWGAGRVPVGVNTSDSNFNSVEKTGGEKTHTLKTSEIPPHTHNYYRLPNAALSGLQEGTGATIEPLELNQRDIMEKTANAGGGGAHNNLQPYITCYMWKRTA